MVGTSHCRRFATPIELRLRMLELPCLRRIAATEGVKPDQVQKCFSKFLANQSQNSIFIIYEGIQNEK